MAAYVISEVEMRDLAAMEAYRALAAQTIAQYGGRYLVRGGKGRACRRQPPAEGRRHRRIRIDGRAEGMVRLAGICRGADPAADGAGAAAAVRRGRCVDLSLRSNFNQIPVKNGR